MVALNENFACENPSPGSKNRVWDFFGDEDKARLENRLPAQQPRREHGHGYDETASGMFFYGYRYYDSVTGRWPSRDPLSEWSFFQTALSSNLNISDSELGGTCVKICFNTKIIHNS